MMTSSGRAMTCSNCGCDEWVDEGTPDLTRRCTRCGRRVSEPGETYVSSSWVECPVCGQDWAKPSRLPGQPDVFWMCAECDSVWPTLGDVATSAPAFLNDLVPPADQRLVERLDHPDS